ncbi:ARH protein, partial [Columbina picui]|nr:ARH protein [Columbina picui]
MDALKSAGRALLRSPSVHKPAWAGGRHKKLPENWTDTRETLLEGMLFSLKYMGMTLVEQPKGEELSAAAVKRIVATAKASGKKLQKVTLKVSPRGIVLNDSGTNELIENVSIYRISYCTADKIHDKAQAVTLTVAQAFKIAFEFWQAAKEGETLFFPSLLHPKIQGMTLGFFQFTSAFPLALQIKAGPSLGGCVEHPGCKLRGFMFSLLFSPLRLAQSRTNPHVLDTGLTAQDIQSAETLSPVDWSNTDSSAGEKDDLFMF